MKSDYCNVTRVTKDWSRPSDVNSIVKQQITQILIFTA